jgi:5'-3' exonuclease
MGVNFNTMMSNGSLLVVDGLNAAFRYQDYDDFTDDYIRTIRSLAKTYRCSNIIIAADKGSSQYRKAIYPEYKANRKEKYETQTEEEREKFERFFQNWESTCLVLEQEFPVLRFQGVEADDIAAYIVKKRPKFDIEHIWLISSDRDWNLLVNESVSQFSLVTRKEITVEQWAERHDCRIDQYADMKALMGDSGDNIKGVPGIGPKRALQLLDEYGSLYDIIQAVPLPGKQKFIQELNKSQALLELNMQLVDLLTYCEDALGQEVCLEIDKVLESLYG